MCKCQTWGVRGENTDSTRCPIHGGKKMTEHEELLAIHAICMDAANCPEEKEGDTLTVKMVKRMAIFANQAPESSENFVELARRYEKAKDTISEQDRILRSVIEKMTADNGGTVPGWLLDLAP